MFIELHQPMSRTVPQQSCPKILAALLSSFRQVKTPLRKMRAGTVEAWGCLASARFRFWLVCLRRCIIWIGRMAIYGMVMDVEGSVHDLFQGIIRTYAWRDLWYPRVSIRIAGFPTEIRTRNHPSTLILVVLSPEKLRQRLSEMGFVSTHRFRVRSYRVRRNVQICFCIPFRVDETPYGDTVLCPSSSFIVKLY
jgi:hypothetical protein